MRTRKKADRQSSSGDVNIEAKTVLAKIVEELRHTPGALWPEDGDVWEEIKEQVQGELSSAWPAYIETIKGVIDHKVASLAPTRLPALSGELKVPAGDSARISGTLFRRLLSRARKERIGYESLGFDYFWYTLSGLTIYNKIIKRTGGHTCWVLAYSGACATGEHGEIDLGQIDRMTDIHIMTTDDFEKARRLNWREDFSPQEVMISDRDRSSAPTRRVPSRISAKEVLSRVQALRAGNAQWNEVLSELNPTGDTEVQQLLIEIRGPNMFGPHLGLGVIEDGCERALALSPTADALAALREAIGRQDRFMRD